MPLESRPCTLDELAEMAAAGELYAVLDACDTPLVPAKAAELGEGRAACLYSGTAEEEYWSIAPYLVQVDTKLLSWIQETLWGEPWGVFAVAKADFETVRRHFKKFLIVEAPDGERWYFRYYDPRVLEDFLPTCNDDQLTEMFGLLQGYAVAGDGELALIRWQGTSSIPDPQPAPPTETNPPPRLNISF
jgi:hypothetical protein